MGGETPADSHCETTRANVIHCPASPHVVLGCHTRIRSGATDLVSPQTKSNVDSQKHFALYTAPAKKETLTYDATSHYQFSA